MPIYSPTMHSLAGRTALVTGATAGIGRAIAVGLAAAGAEVGTVGRDPGRLASVVAEIATTGGRAVPLPTELADDAALMSLVQQVRQQLGGLDILVHCGGAYERGPVEHAPVSDFDTLYRVNLRAPYLLTQQLLPELRARSADVVFINSSQGLAASAELSQLATTQHGLKAMADALRAEINDAGVRVLTIHVGRTATPRQERIFRIEGRPYAPERLIQPADIAHLVVASLTLPRSAEVTSMTVRSMKKP
jgi:NAD(P)-dependent dehydrogenase (short-subunit alcohol dehydrogenase family)